MKIGILRETKVPPDRRVPLTPSQCRELLDSFPETQLVVQPSGLRCFADKEYRALDIPLEEDLTSCDVLMGVKEVDTSTLIPGKRYLFFSHTAKEQPYNQELLAEIHRKGITLIDYEYLTNRNEMRVVAFGRWAGIVGTYNGLRAYGERTGRYDLPPAGALSGLPEMKNKIRNLPAGKVRIVLTGGGRVALGAMEILDAAGIREISPVQYLGKKSKNDGDAVFCRLDPWHYTRLPGNREFDFNHFVAYPSEYENSFLPYATVSDLFIACHFWDPDAPVLLTQEDLASDKINLGVIADISCDINGPIASTIRPSTIEDPVYGYDPETGREAKNPYDDKVITVMAVDNLPGELPRDASEDFGNALLENVIPYLAGDDTEGTIERATITRSGELTSRYSYLKDYLEGKS